MVNEDFTIDLERVYNGVNYTVTSSEKNGESAMNTIDTIRSSNGHKMTKKRYEWKVLFDEFVSSKQNKEKIDDIAKKHYQKGLFD